MANSEVDESVQALLIAKRSSAERYADDVVVLASRDRWNDFGYRIRVEIGLPAKGDAREWIAAYFAVKDKKNLDDLVGEITSLPAEAIPLAKLTQPFASLLIESKSYSWIRRQVGIDSGKAILLALHDASFFNSINQQIPGWPDFYSSDAFVYSMTRSSETYFSFRHGADILNGRRTSGVDARQPIRVEVTGYGPNLHFDFAFSAENALRGRIAVIIGKNGSGKTSSLARLAAGFSTDRKRGVAFLQRPEVNQVLVFAHSGALHLFKQRSDRTDSAAVRLFALDPSAYGARNNGRDSNTRQLVDIARSTDHDFRPLEAFISIFEKEFQGLTLYIPIKAGAENLAAIPISVRNADYIKLQSWMRGGEAQQLSSLAAVDHGRELLFVDDEQHQREFSLGQRTFLNFSLSALANAGPASVFLIDEPENFLHPNLVSGFMRVLHRSLEATKSIAIIATHSPFVVREVQSVQVHVIRTSGEAGSTSVVHPRLQTLGANVSSIADEVFGDDLPEHLFELVLKESIERSMPFPDVLERFAGELSTEALMFLRRRLENTTDDSGQ